jgi:hypothetical protein
MGELRNWGIEHPRNCLKDAICLLCTRRGKDAREKVKHALLQLWRNNAVRRRMACCKGELYRVLRVQTLASGPGVKARGPHLLVLAHLHSFEWGREAVRVGGHALDSNDSGCW